MSLLNNPITQTSNLGLVIIDVQSGSKYLSEHVFKKLSPNNFDQIVSNNQRLIDAFVAHQLPVFIVTMQPKMFPKLINDTFSRPLLTSEATNIYHVQKKTASAFKEPTFLDALQQSGVKHLVITGFTADNGVRKTVRDGQREGYAATVITDAIVAKSNELYQEAIRTFAQVADTDAMITSLNA